MTTSPIRNTHSSRHTIRATNHLPGHRAITGNRNGEVTSNQALFQRYNAFNGALKKQIITDVETIFLYPIKDQLTGFGQFMALEMMGHIFRANREIENINLEENAVKITGPYNPEEPPACLIEKLDKGQ